MHTFHVEELKDHHIVTFLTIVFEPEQNEIKSIKCVTKEAQVTVKKSDMAHKKWDINDVKKFIEEKLINLIAVDFDKTLSNVRLGEKDDTSKKSLIGGVTTKRTVKQLSGHKRNHLFIATHSSASRVKEYLNGWGIHDCFSSIQDSTITKRRDKGICFPAAFSEKLKNSTAVKNGFLDLDSQDPLGVNQAIIVDDDFQNNISPLEKRKFSTIWVDSRDITQVGHWDKLQKLVPITDMVVKEDEDESLKNPQKPSLFDTIDLDEVGITPPPPKKQFAPLLQSFGSFPLPKQDFGNSSLFARNTGIFTPNNNTP